MWSICYVKAQNCSSPAINNVSCSSTSTAASTVTNHKQWAKSSNKRRAQVNKRDEASDKIMRLADAKSEYYEKKMELKKIKHEMLIKQHKMFEIEHNAKMEVLKLEKSVTLTN